MCTAIYIANSAFCYRESNILDKSILNKNVEFGCRKSMFGLCDLSFSLEHISILSQCSQLDLNQVTWNCSLENRPYYQGFKALVVRSGFIHFCDGFNAYSVNCYLLFIIAYVLRYILRTLHFVTAKAIYWTKAFSIRMLSLAAGNQCLDCAISAFHWSISQYYLNVLS